MLAAIATLAGAAYDAYSSNKTNKQQLDLAKNTIKYRTEDAKRSGIHPLYALNAPTMSSNVTNTNMAQGLQAAAGQINNNQQKQLLQANIDKTLAETDAIKQQAQASQLAMIKNAVGTQQDVPDLYVKVRDNVTGDIVHITNPDLGLDMSETVGNVVAARGTQLNKSKKDYQKAKRRAIRNTNPRSRKRKNPRSATFSTKKGY